jgi:hypothetical protein
VECCLKRKGAYYHDLAAPARNRRGVRRDNRLSGGPHLPEKCGFSSGEGESRTSAP